MLEHRTQNELDSILKIHDYDKSHIVAIMQEIQDKYHYLPENILIYLAKELEISEAKIYEVAAFYEKFSLKPKGKYIIKICDGTACHVHKSLPILKEFRNQLKVTSESPTTDNMLFTVETVSCLGSCGLAPVCTINDKVYPSMTPEKVKYLISQLKEEIK